ncbi:hypothetical protein EVAR_33245_1 [Eumeta japonica]|uniref:Uncharacterized protein n=1 Tax=Eumeta variegata TaxID=151549 RepID=A0A4C1X2Q1_EUMVA|nr:hypothetical protein EVAR_33245_1 [Eumeta japonica]
MATFSSIITPWLPYSIKVLVKSNQTSPNSMGLRRLITEFLWLPSAPSSRPGYHIASKYSSSRTKRAQTRSFIRMPNSNSNFEFELGSFDLLILCHTVKQFCVTQS